jgi:protein associated with RNAse G/E
MPGGVIKMNVIVTSSDESLIFFEKVRKWVTRRPTPQAFDSEVN